ncbi:hypothetical protein [Sorangium sp. So ce1099]|uniref:hypothetical protein n=1 Tax=Sorangium sp. So ce1099 TaxID=3133331 RepID=UPI003F5EFC99
MKQRHKDLIALIRAMRDEEALEAEMSEVYERWVVLIDEGWADPNPHSLRGAIATICRDLLTKEVVRKL